MWVSATACETLPTNAQVLSVSALLREAVLRATSWRDGSRSAAQNHLTEVILEEIRAARPVPLGLPMPQDPRLLKIARALSEHPNDCSPMGSWAKWAGVAPRTLSRRFVIETGFRFSEWRQRVRLLQALELLAAGQSVTNVALGSGYENVSAFITLFRQVFGMTPGRYAHSIALSSDKPAFSALGSLKS
ncbi:helix-turn-helix transcriptional regulator [Rahnella sp. BCC 1045]|nr:helix-turn-helix transcriptional regulator [Rahnella sp. BCC 1045]